MRSKGTVIVIIFLVVNGCFMCEGARKYAHYMHTVAPGTRSEGRVGLLLYENEPILPYVKEIMTPIGRFRYEYRRLPFEKEGVGWQRIPPENEEQLKILPEKITEEELERGWYNYISGKQKKGTPDVWIWVPSCKKWVSPERINDSGIYAEDNWEYVIEVKDRDNWFIRGRLFLDNEEIKGEERDETIKTPIGEFKWTRRPHTEDGWLRKCRD